MVETNDDVTHGISDARNGLLLWFSLHCAVGSRDSAFIKVTHPSQPGVDMLTFVLLHQTPNFALSVDDIP